MKEKLVERKKEKKSVPRSQLSSSLPLFSLFFYFIFSLPRCSPGLMLLYQQFLEFYVQFYFFFFPLLLLVNHAPNDMCVQAERCKKKITRSYNINCILSLRVIHQPLSPIFRKKKKKESTKKKSSQNQLHFVLSTLSFLSSFFNTDTASPSL